MLSGQDTGMQPRACTNASAAGSPILWVKISAPLVGDATSMCGGGDRHALTMVSSTIEN